MADPVSPASANEVALSLPDEHEQDATAGDDALIIESSETLEVVTTFDQMGLQEDLLHGIHAYGFERPLVIQQRAILPIISGRDMVVQASSGSGKTAASLIAILQVLDVSTREPQVLVLSPTTERAVHAQSAIVALGDFMNVQCLACVRGTPVRDHVRDLKSGVHVVSGTPGRILNMIRRKDLQTKSIKVLLVDQADELSATESHHETVIDDVHRHLPPATQVVLLATTLPDSLLQTAARLLKNPIRISTERNVLTLEGIRQFFVPLEEEWKFETLCDICALSGARSIVICNTRRKVEWLTEELSAVNLEVLSMHGEMPKMEHDAIMSIFRSGTGRILVTTDIRTRGITMQQSSFIINYDLPENRENYFDRICRFGRWGQPPIVINLITVDDVMVLRAIEKYYSTQIDELPDNLDELLE